jgi:hypothetical protein
MVVDDCLEIYVEFHCIVLRALPDGFISIPYLALILKPASLYFYLRNRVRVLA